MTIINLASPSKSNVSFKIISFSDTQELITLEDTKRLYLEDTVRIVSRMSWRDLQLIIQVVHTLKELKVQSIELFVPYFLGARSDRKFSNGSTNYMKNIIAPMINNLGLDKVYVQDPHSMAVELLIDNLEVGHLLSGVLSNTIISFRTEGSYFLVSPDEGAIKRTEAVFAERGSKCKGIVKCIKHRDPHTGAIMGVEVLSNDLEGENCFIVDDICDGGATFLAVAEELKAKNAGDLYLCVSHGIFSKGFDKLKEYYSGIGTTNSVREFTEEEKKHVAIYTVI